MELKAVAKRWLRGYQRRVRVRPLLLCAFVLCGDAADVAFAHNGSSKFIELRPREDVLVATVDVDVIDVAMELDLDPDADATFVTGAPREALSAWLVRTISIEVATTRCPVRLSDATLTTRNHVRYVRATLEYACPDGGEPVLRDEAVFGDDAQHESYVDFGAGRVEVLRRGRQQIPLALETAAPDRLRQIGVFLVEGVLHLALGYDHLLFLLTLLLVSGEVARREGMKKSLRSVVMIVTAFTLGHSVTLIAAALDIVQLPVRWVEAAIALSIALVAVLNVTRPSAGRSRIAIAGLFGLIHGFGFSNVLRELSLPTGDRVLGLLAFNVGIELGQLAFVVLVMGPLAWAASHDWYRRAVIHGGSTAIAAVGMFWFIERIVG
jgi:hypothetical protein